MAEQGSTGAPPREPWDSPSPARLVSCASLTTNIPAFLFQALSVSGEHTLGSGELLGLTPRGSLECNPEIPAFPGEEN